MFRWKMKLRMNGDSLVTLMLQLNDYEELFYSTTIKLVYTSSNFEIKNQYIPSKKFIIDTIL